MGQKRGRNNQSNDKQEGGNNNNHKHYTPQVNREEIDNKIFEEYYKSNIVPEDQWDQMVTVMKAILPSSFRLSNISGPQEKLLNILNGDCFGIPEEPAEVVDPNGNKFQLKRPEVLPWYRPKGNAYQIDLGRQQLKHFQQLEKFRTFLMENDTVGNITRQEAVSMIPPLLLDVKPEHVVLDMCAAPGSKTSQLLEALHLGLSEGEIPTGVCVANDANSQRAHMLVHQLKRLGSPAFLVTNHDAQFFPALYEKDGKTPVQFDRILCDVPCGGDGTMRKTPTVWSNWSLHNSYALQPLQLQIAWRGLQLLKEGGYMVYSTCSINPLEDESVVMELIRRGGGNLELISIPEALPELKYSAGRTDWKNWVELPKTRNEPQRLVEITCLAELLALPENVKAKLYPTSFSPKLLEKLYDECIIYAEEQMNKWRVHVAEEKAKKTPEEIAIILANKPVINVPKFKANGRKIKSNEKQAPYVVDKLVQRILRTKERHSIEDINKTVRVLPHLQNSGGFYIALIKKTGPIPDTDELAKPLPYAYNLQYIDYDVHTFDEKLHAQTAVNNKLTQLAKAVARQALADKAAASIVAAKMVNEDTSKVEEAVPAVTNDSDNDDDDDDDFAKQAISSTPVEDDKKLINKGGYGSKHEDPFTLSPDFVHSCAEDVYGAKSKIPLLTRQGNRQYIVSEALLNLLLNNPKLHVVHGGLKAFELEPKMGSSYNDDSTTHKHPFRFYNQHYHRLCQDGIDFIFPFISRQIIEVERADAIKFLSQKKDESTTIDDLSPAVKQKYFSNPGEADLNKVTRSGSCVISYYDEELKKRFLFCAFKRGYTLHIQVDAADKAGLLSQLGHSQTFPSTANANDDSATELVQLPPLSDAPITSAEQPM